MFVCVFRGGVGGGGGGGGVRSCASLWYIADEKQYITYPYAHPQISPLAHKTTKKNDQGLSTEVYGLKLNEWITEKANKQINK